MRNVEVLSRAVICLVLVPINNIQRKEMGRETMSGAFSTTWGSSFCPGPWNT